MAFPSNDDMNPKQPLISEPVPQENPPAYEFGAEADGTKPQAPKDDSSNQVLIIRRNEAGPSGSYTMQPSSIPPPTVFNYLNPRTGEHVVSLLPPNHPEMVCLQAGEHEPETHYGVLGVLAAIFWFPLGIGLCLLDKRVKCKRCGVVIEDGMCR